MATKVERTGGIRVTDGSGNFLMLDIYTTSVLYKPFAEPQQWIASSKAYKLGSESCNSVDENTWEAINTGRILRRA